MGQFETVTIHNSKKQLIYERNYQNTYSYYFANYTLKLFEPQHTHKEFFDYQMQKIIFDLNEKKINLN